MRRPPRDPALTAPRSDEGLVNRRTYQFLTPVFGGGVLVDGQHKHADPVTPVRVASIRGQLRFWWRACNPEKCKTVDELREAESRLFGSAESPSVLSIVVEKQPADTRDVKVLVNGDKFDAPRGGEDLAYGAFPLRAAKEPYEHGVLHEHSGEWAVRYQLQAGVSDEVNSELRRGLDAALWAWAHFGALGGRTRRGFGAFAQVSPNLASVDEGWETHVSGEKVPWPHLPRSSSAKVSKRSCEDGRDAQNYLLGKLRELRQGPLGRKPKTQTQTGRPGRSYWPEANEIRRTFRRHSVGHEPPGDGVRAFPRAAFGMPIIFHFKDRDDPADATLQPRGMHRLASRLILRPHQAGKTVQAMAVVLEHPMDQEIVLMKGKNDKDPIKVRTDVTQHEARALPNSPLVKNGVAFVDPIQRFLEEI